MSALSNRRPSEHQTATSEFQLQRSPVTKIPSLPATSKPAASARVQTSETMRSANPHTLTSNIHQISDHSAFQPRVDNVVIAISSGALFDFTQDHQVAAEHGPAAYEKYQLEHETSVLDKGVAFDLAEKLYKINQKLADVNSPIRFDVVIISKNTPDACIRATHSAKHYNLPIRRAAFSNGASPFKYAKAFGACLYLTTNPDDARQGIAEGIPSAHMLPFKSKPDAAPKQEQLRVAFDADAVIFSDASERISMKQGLQKFYDHEHSNAKVPLEKGPLWPLLSRLSELKKAFPRGEAPIRISITTARSAPADERLLRTLRSWGIDIDELHLLGGKDKGPFLEAFQADIFFDDKYKNAEHGAGYVASGHVNYGVSNE